MKKYYRFRSLLKGLLHFSGPLLTSVAAIEILITSIAFGANQRESLKPKLRPGEHSSSQLYLQHFVNPTEQQFKMWQLEDQNRFEEAQAIAADIEHRLRTEKIVGLNLKLLEIGAGSAPVAAELESGLIAVVKGPDSAYARGADFEEVAYLIDRVLGLNIVPITVTRVIDGKTYSLQLYLERIKATPEEQRRLYSEDNRFKSNLIDFLTQNADRNKQNSLFIRDRQIAIDHSRSRFYKIKDAKDINPAPKLSRYNTNAVTAILANARFVRYSDFSNIFAGKLSADEVFELYSRIHTYNEPLSQDSARPSYSELAQKTEATSASNSFKFHYDKQISFSRLTDLSFVFYPAAYIQDKINTNGLNQAIIEIDSFLKKLDSITKFMWLKARIPDEFENSSFDAKVAIFSLKLNNSLADSWGFGITQTEILSVLLNSRLARNFLMKRLEDPNWTISLFTVNLFFRAIKSTDAEINAYFRAARSLIAKRAEKSPEISYSIYKSYLIEPALANEDDFIKVLTASLTRYEYREEIARSIVIYTILDRYSSLKDFHLITLSNLEQRTGNAQVTQQLRVAISLFAKDNSIDLNMCPELFAFIHDQPNSCEKLFGSIQNTGANGAK